MTKEAVEATQEPSTPQRVNPGVAGYEPDQGFRHRSVPTHETTQRARQRIALEELLQKLPEDSPQLAPFRARVASNGNLFTIADLHVLGVHLKHIGTPRTKRQLAAEAYPTVDEVNAVRRYNNARDSINNKRRRAGLQINSITDSFNYKTHEIELFIPDNQEKEDSIGVLSQASQAENRLPVARHLKFAPDYIVASRRSPQTHFAPDPTDRPEVKDIKERLRNANANFSWGQLKVLEYHLAHFGERNLKSDIASEISQGASPTTAIQRYANARGTINARLSELGLDFRIGSFPVEGPQTSHNHAGKGQRTSHDIVFISQETAVQDQYSDELDEDDYESTEEGLEDTPAEVDYQSGIASLYGEILPSLNETDRNTILKFGRELARVVTTAIIRNQPKEGAQEIPNLPRDILDPNIPTRIDSNQLQNTVSAIQAEEHKKAVLVQSAIAALEAAEKKLDDKFTGDATDFALRQNITTLANKGIYIGEVSVRLASHFMAGNQTEK